MILIVPRSLESWPCVFNLRNGGVISLAGQSVPTCAQGNG